MIDIDIYSKVMQQSAEFEERTGIEPNTLIVSKKIYFEIKAQIHQLLQPLELKNAGDLYYARLRLYVSNDVKDVVVGYAEEGDIE